MDSLTTIREQDISNIVKEDVLRILGEEKEKTSFESLRSKIKVSNPFFSKTIRNLEQEGIIQIEKGSVKLTTKGKGEAKYFLNKHFLLENYFNKRRSQKEAHKTTDLLEHYLSEEVIDNIKMLSTLKNEGVPLTELKIHKEGIITDIMFTDNALLERIISMGIFLGEKIVITNKIHHSLIIKIKNKKFALNEELAKHIKVVGYEKT